MKSRLGAIASGVAIRKSLDGHDGVHGDEGIVGEALPMCFEKPHEIPGYQNAQFTEMVAEKMARKLYPQNYAF